MTHVFFGALATAGFLVVGEFTAVGCGGGGDVMPEPGPVDTGAPDTRPRDSGRDSAHDANTDSAMPAPLAALPPEASGATARFATQDECAMCHSGGGGVLEDAAGRDVSMSRLFRSSMMAFSARDPYYLAVFSHELETHPEGREVIEDVCTRCHAPAAAQELNRAGSHVSFEALTSGTSSTLAVGRDGVTCTVCHQIEAEGLGTPATFTGTFSVGDERMIFGPHEAPFAQPMMMHTGYTPTHSEHIEQSALCASCHTVLTRAMDDDGGLTGPLFAEQAPFLEWRSSAFGNGVDAGVQATCQDCHVPTVDEDGTPIVAPISSRPPWLDARAPVSRHIFAGANAYMLELLADNREWAGIRVPEAEIRASAQRSADSLTTAAELSIERVRVVDGELQADVRVRNLTGHKLPTAYPTRRVWLHVQVLGDADEVLWESGAYDERGALVDGSGVVIESLADVLPHRDVVSSEDQVQVYQTVMADADGRATSVLLDATGYLKDNRLLPIGWAPSTEDAALIAPVGIGDDGDFVAGQDVVGYRATVPPSAARRVRVSLLYQSIPPLHVDALRDHPTPATARLIQMMEARPSLPRLIAQVEREL